nr:MAG TPA: hypothetical protein [Caudoviricetes sp.]
MASTSSLVYPLLVRSTSVTLTVILPLFTKIALITTNTPLSWK